MDKKLSVLQRTTDKTGWDKSTQFSTTDIKNIKVYTARNDRSLNAIPSPLARIHLFEAAFDLLDKDEMNKTNFTGDAYKKIVSDCFDVFELLYNWNGHLADNKKLNLTVWDQETALTALKNGTPRHNLLAKTLEIFLNEEAFRRSNKILIIKYNDKPIAGSSPFTGFFTTPNSLSNFGLYNLNNGRDYFSRVVSFDQRKPEIRKYIYDFFFESELKLAESTRVIRDYLNKFVATIPHEPLRLVPLESNYNTIFGSVIQSSGGRTPDDYLEKSLVRIDFPINEECFFTPILKTNQKNSNYLLPLKKAFFEDFNAREIPAILTIDEVDSNTVNVTIQKGGLQFRKRYKTDNTSSEYGTIIDLNERFGIKVNLGIFPFIKVVHGPEGSEEPLEAGFNDYYKIMLVCQDNNHRFNNSDFKLSFNIEGKLLSSPTNDNHVVDVDHRTLLDQVNQPTGSSYYTLKGKDKRSVCFDYMSLQFPELNGELIACAIVPRWRTLQMGIKQVDYAIDFGTTTTFIAYTDNRERTAASKPLSFDINRAAQELDYPIALLSKPAEKTEHLNWIDTFERGPKAFLESVAFQNEEFIPSLINQDRYQVPFRTVIYQKDGVPESGQNLFGNANISFIYQKFLNNATHKGQRYITNLKWKVNTDKSYEELIKLFIEEVFMMMRLKTILKGGDPRLSKVTWFSPLSFSPEAQRGYQRIWESKFKDIFHADVRRLKNVTESEAPYYYYVQSAHIDDPSAVLTVDIGGGTTDIMYVRDKPVLCTSVNFGANVLWGNGFTDLVDTAKDNGIYNAIKSTIDARVRPTILKSMNDDYNREDSSFSSDEIINFWIANNETTDVLRELDNGQFRLTYLLHFTALIYHACQILKHKNFVPPTSIIFSGNGSKYLDLIQSTGYISKICAYFVNIIFKKECKVPQIILPPENRKEATCYGVLYQEFDLVANFETITYIGTEPTGKSYAKYGDIDLHKSEVFAGVENSFHEFLDCFFRMNDETGLSFRTTFGIKTDLLAAKNFLLAKTAENLDVGYRKRKQTVGKDDPITDSLFFNPLIGLLFKLNKLSVKDLEAYIPKVQLFAANIDGNIFLAENLTTERKQDTIYTLTLDHLNPEQAELNILAEDKVFRRALSSIPGYLEPVCQWAEYPTGPDQRIIIKKTGLVRKENKQWNIVEKIQVEFI